MAIENVANISESAILNVLASLPGMSTVIRLGQIAIIVIIVYLAFLIIRSIMQIRYAFSMKKLIDNVEEINKKMDALIGKRIKKH